MTTQELHIQLELLLQKVNSHWNQNFLPQEKDTFINREVLKFIKQRLNPLSNIKKQSIFDILKRNQDLNSLVKTVPISVVNINQKEDAYHLPFDFLYYVSSSLDVTPVCGKTILPPIDKVLYKVTFPSFKNLNDLETLVISITQGSVTTEVFNLSMLPEGYLPDDGIDDYKKVFILNNAILNILLKKLPLLNVEVRFDKYLNVFELRSSSTFSISVVENTVVVPSPTTSTSLKGNQQPKSLEASIRIVDEEFKSNIKRSSLSRTRDESVVGYLRDTEVILPLQSSVVYNTAYLTYICKPAKVDVFLSHNSDLPDEVLEEVISNTAQTLKGVISSDSYEKFANENLLIE